MTVETAYRLFQPFCRPAGSRHPRNGRGHLPVPGPHLHPERHIRRGQALGPSPARHLRRLHPLRRRRRRRVRDALLPGHGLPHPEGVLAAAEQRPPALGRRRPPRGGVGDPVRVQGRPRDLLLCR